MWVRPPDRPGPRNNFPDLAIRDGKWKLLVFRDGSSDQLYDLDADPNEKNNLAKTEPERAAWMTREVIAWDQAMSRNSAK